MQDDFIAHYGVKRRSGRYPWGSGDEPFQRGSDSTINGVARDLNNRDLVGASKSLGIYGKKISTVKSDPHYNDAKSLLAGSYSSEEEKIYGRNNKPEKLPNNSFWDEERNCWCANASVAYWDEGKGIWETGGKSNSRIYYSSETDRWVNENGENVAYDSWQLNSNGFRYAQEGIPGNAVWNPEEERWEINSVVPPTRKWNDQTKTYESVVWNDQKNTWEPAIWNPSTKSYEPKEKRSKVWNDKTNDWDIFEWNPKTKSYEPTGNTPKEDKKGVLDSLLSALKNMGGFFKRKISEIIDKFND